MKPVQIFTIGFTQTSAADFFAALRAAGVVRVVDVRLNNTSQLASFSKRDDLAFFLRELAGIDYVHLPLLAPTQELLDAFKKQKGSWADYEEAFLRLMRARAVEQAVPRDLLQRACLLCSERQPQCCHRRLVAEYLQSCWGDVEIVHLPRDDASRPAPTATRQRRQRSG